MAQVSMVEKLPLEIREQLNQKILEPTYYSLDKLTEWLSEIGHPVSRSSIHRYVLAFKDKHNGDASIISDAYLKLECLKVAAQINTTNDLEQLKNDAKEILEWLFKD